MAYSPNSKNIHMAVADEEFTCPLCCEVFQEPKLLPNCAHSFCKACLRELILRSISSRVSCPVCRKTSNVPRNGVEGFATNTLLVRLIDNIPGRKDKEAVWIALAHCKEEIEKNKNIQDELEKKLSKINKNKEQGLKLKREISEHAQCAIDSITQWEQNLCKEVDSYLEESCGLKFHDNPEEQRMKWQSHMEGACTCVKSVEEMLNRNEMGEIMEMKKIIVEQLNEYSSFPSCPSLKEVCKIQDFKMELKKLEVKQDLGNVVKAAAKIPTPLTVYSGYVSVSIISNARSEDSERSHSSSSTSASSGEASRSSNSRPSSSRTNRNRSHVDVGQVDSVFSLRFEPYRLAICPRSNDVALLWEERKQVHLYSSNGEHMKTIFIKYGDLWDVGFTIDDEIVVVNREHNRLLLYEKDGQFISYEVETPRDSLKYTYVSVDSDGRLIVTSTEVDDEDDIIPCIVVYNNGCEESCKMFGRRVLVKPVSRVIHQNRQFYIADQCDNETIIRRFTFQGEHISNIHLSGTVKQLSLSTVENSGYVFLIHTSRGQDDKSFLSFIDDGNIVHTKKQENPYSDLRQGVVISHTLRSITQAEIYLGVDALCIARY